ncbi:MAG TPA: hypothetical protein VIN67_00435, partial [Desulfobaccales bacterium]
PTPSSDNPAPMLAAKVDGLLSRVCKILNMWPKKPQQLRIYLLKNGREVRQRQLALQPFLQEGSFWEDDSLEGLYDPLTRSIYLSLKDLRVGILAHEMTHYVLNEAFAVPPPASVQEHWAHYVERQVD